MEFNHNNYSATKETIKLIFLKMINSKNKKLTINHLRLLKKLWEIYAYLISKNQIFLKLLANIQIKMKVTN